MYVENVIIMILVNYDLVFKIKLYSANKKL